MDSTERGHTGVASYYTETGEIAGRWIGSGVEGIEGLDVGDIVTAEQMQSLFGSGHHPLAVQRAAALAGNPKATEQDMLDAIRLGQPFKVYANDISLYRVEVARRLEALNKANGRPAKAASTIEDRARIRAEVGLESRGGASARPCHRDPWCACADSTALRECIAGRGGRSIFVPSPSFRRRQSERLNDGHSASCPRRPGGGQRGAARLSDGCAWQPSPRPAAMRRLSRQSAGVRQMHSEGASERHTTVSETR